MHDDRDEEQKQHDRDQRKEELRKDREEQGLETDDTTLNGLVEEEEKQKRRVTN